MTKQYQISTRPFWKLAGFTALGLSFFFTAWILGQAVHAISHLFDLFAGFLQDNAPAWLGDDHNPLN